MTTESYANELFTNWCECSPYGDQVPDDWSEHMAQFVKAHTGKDAQQMAELIMEAPPDDPFEKLLLSIFITAVQFVLTDISNAVYDQNKEKLQLIGIP